MTGYIMIDHNKANVKAKQIFDTYSTIYNKTPALHKIRWSVDTEELFRHIGRSLLKLWVSPRLKLLSSTTSPLTENQPLSVQTWTLSLGNRAEVVRQTVGFYTLTQKCFFLVYSG